MCGGQGEDFLRDLIAIEPVVVLNAAFCERHMKHCPKSQQLLQECAKVPARLSMASNPFSVALHATACPLL